MIETGGEYGERGDYHRALDKNWSYYPVYVVKMDYIRSYLRTYGVNKKILDIGCGEGILVEEFRQRGYDIKGMDKNYESDFVERGDITAIGYEAESFDIVLCLDVLEHLPFPDQERALSEMTRILKKQGGILVASVPNLAHFASRLTFLLTGRLLRTSEANRHLGDRPVGEYLKLIRCYLQIKKRVGFFPTFPLISLVTLFWPGRVVWLHRIYNKVFAYPNWCFLNIVIAHKK